MKISSIQPIQSVPTLVTNVYRKNLRASGTKSAAELNQDTWDKCVRVTISDAARQLLAQSLKGSGVPNE